MMPRETVVLLTLAGGVEEKVKMLESLGTVCACLALFFLAVSAALFRMYDIWAVIGERTGWTARKSIRELERRNGRGTKRPAARVRRRKTVRKTAPERKNDRVSEETSAINGKAVKGKKTVAIRKKHPIGKLCFFVFFLLLASGKPVSAAALAELPETETEEEIPVDDIAPILLSMECEQEGNPYPEGTYYRSGFQVVYRIRDDSFLADYENGTCSFTVEADCTVAAADEGETQGKLTIDTDGMPDENGIMEIVMGVDPEGKAIAREEYCLNLRVTDAAGNVLELEDVRILDTAPPVFSCAFASAEDSEKEKNEEYGNRYYFNKPFVFFVKVEEENFDGERIFVKKAGISASADVDGSVICLDRPEDFSEKLVANGTTYAQTVAEEGLFRYLIYGTDKAGNELISKVDDEKCADNLDGTLDIDHTLGTTAFFSVHAVLDMTAPVIALEARETDSDGTLFYKAALSGTEGYRQEINAPYRSAEQALVSIEGADFSPMKLSYAFQSTADLESEETAFTGDNYGFGIKREVIFQGRQIFCLKEMEATDLAGNVSRADPEAYQSSVPGLETAASTLLFLDNISPTCGSGEAKLSLTSAGGTEGTAVGEVFGPDGNRLYAGDVMVSAVIEDSGRDQYSSGLYWIRYSVEVNGSDWTDKVKASMGEEGYISFGTAGPDPEEAVAENEDLTHVETVSFTFDAATFNYNDIKLTVWAADNAGNEILKERYASIAFGIDITRPIVRVSYDNNSVLNEKYFRDDRTATIEVAERNFDKNATEILTEEAARISEWSCTRGSLENGDDDVWACQVLYSADGDYTFGVTATDLAGNQMEGNVDYGDSAAPEAFIIDKTVPVITVSYSTYDARNEWYYRIPRTATIRIHEHNFRSSEVETLITAMYDGAALDPPALIGWSHSGDDHTAYVAFDRDGEFAFDLRYTDLAGNEAEDYPEDSFIIDLTAPSVIFSGVENASANNGTVAPTVEILDTNHDADSVSLLMSGCERGVVEFETVRTSTPGGQSIRFLDIPHLRKNDDLYTLTVGAEDLAGNQTQESLVFSVNRFGSIYLLSDETKKLTESFYANEEQNLKVEEINVDALQEREVAYTLNGELTVLQEGRDYTVREAGNDGTWKTYQYQIGKGNFSEEGIYTVTISSKDRAENRMNNRISSKEIIFAIDKTPPSVVVTGVEDGMGYRADSGFALIDVRDNIRMEKLWVYLNGSKTAQEYGREEIEEAGGLLRLSLSASDDWQTLRTVSRDAAGNQTETEEIRFLITSSFFYQWYRNTPLFYGGVATLSLAGIMLGAGTVLKRNPYFS